MIRSWEELLQKELRIDVVDTRAEMVRVSIIAYLGCAATGVLSLGVSRWQAASPAVALAVILVTACAALVLYFFGRRLTLPVLILQAPAAALLLALGFHLENAGSASMLPMFYVLVVLYGTFFFRTWMVAGLIVFCGLSFAWATIANGDPDWPTRVVMSFGVSVTVGLFAGILVKRVHERSTVDWLTGLINRRMWEFLAQQEVRKAERSRRPLSILLIDLDRFKAINDEFGHLHGDDVLKRVADVLRRILREVDAPCRWGGDEFAVLLPDCDSDQVKVVGERLQDELGSVLEFSLGAATWRPGLSARDLFQLADENLYAAKSIHDGPR